MNQFKFITRAAILSVSLSIPYYSFADHLTRTIANYSTMPWEVQFVTSEGNVYFKNIDESQCVNSKIVHDHPQNGPCIIYPQQNITLVYTTSVSQIQGYVLITDYTGESHSLGYNQYWPSPFDLDSSPLDSVKTNRPHGGDMIILLESWGGRCKPGYCAD